MSHRLVTIPHKTTLAPGASFEVPFRPGVAKNMSATADLSDDAYVELLMLDAAGKVVASDPLSRSPVVNFQPKEVGDFRARVINRSSVPLVVVLTVHYYSAEQLATQDVEIDKIVELAEHILHHELKPHVRLRGKRLTITGDHSLVSMLGEWADRELELRVDIDGVDIDASGFHVGFEPPSDGYPFGAIVLRLTSKQEITLTKFLIGKVRIPEPTFTLRAGLNVYGGSIHLAPVVLELPELAPNWVATIGEWAKGVVSGAKADLTRSLARAVASLEDSGRLVSITQKIERALSMQRLHDLRITETHIHLEYEARPGLFKTLSTKGVPAPVSERLEHLVIVMLENRSFDHMMADVVAGRSDVRRAPDTHSETVHDAHGKPHVYRRTKAALHALPHDPPHDSRNQDLQARGLFVESFLEDHPGSPHGAQVLAYQPREQVPFFDFLAREFVICDDWRASLRGHTWPNRQYALAGASKRTAKGFRDNPELSELEFYTNPTICDVLEAQGVDWAYYKDDFAFLELYRRWVFDRTRVRSRAQFREAIEAGTLPRVTWIEPNISDFGRSRGNDDHPPITVYAGQRFLADIYAALRELPTKNWLLVITYDESGGFYDHKPAEDAPDDEPLATKQGFRVPAFLVSPWLAPGRCCPTRFEHASLIRTILDNFCAPEPIFVANKRVAGSASFANILEPSSGYATATARDVPPFTDVIPQVPSFEGVLDGDGTLPQAPLFTAFEEAKQRLLDEQAAKPTPRPAPAPDDALAGLELGAAAPADPLVRFEGLYVQARTLLPELAAAGWTSKPWFDDALETRPPAELAVDVAWDLVHDLRARHPGVVIDPLWETAFTELEPESRGGLAVAGFEAAPANRRWHLDAVRAEAAWQLAPGKGEGIVIGHLDTGYREHPDLDAMQLARYGWDVYRGDADPHDDLERGFLKFPGHGTATGSIIGSRGSSDVMGTAPGVSTIPIRISASVVHISMTNMVRGIQIAIERNVHVISLSAGGLWSAALHRAVRAATDAGIIVVAAAGNFTGVVVWPARFPEVIACGAVNESGGTWFWSNGRRGEHVTVMAPGEDVWVLKPKSATQIDVEASSGTSFATACVAGAIATWLAHHGRDKLIRLYGRANLASIAKAHLRELTRDGDDAGVLDMEQLIRADLPLLPLPPPGAVATGGFEAATQPSTGEPSFDDELAFHEMVDRLSRRSASSASAPESGFELAGAPAPSPSVRIAPRMSARLARKLKN